MSRSQRSTEFFSACLLARGSSGNGPPRLYVRLFLLASRLRFGNRDKDLAHSLFRRPAFYFMHTRADNTPPCTQSRISHLDGTFVPSSLHRRVIDNNPVKPYASLLYKNYWANLLDLRPMLAPNSPVPNVRLDNFRTWKNPRRTPAKTTALCLRPSALFRVPEVKSAGAADSRRKANAIYARLLNLRITLSLR